MTKLRIYLKRNLAKKIVMKVEEEEAAEAVQRAYLQEKPLRNSSVQNLTNMLLKSLVN